MAKKVKTKLKTKKKSKKSESQICKKKRQMILNKLQQATIISQSHMDNSNNLDSMALSAYSVNNETQISSKRNFQLIQTNASSSDNNDVYNDYTCYRCRHFIKIPRNLSPPLRKTTSAFIGRCKIELNFVQAIVWLKSATVSMSQVRVEQLRRIFSGQWNTHDDLSNSPVISNRSCDITSQETIPQSYIISENVSNEILDLASMHDSSKSLANEILTPERYTNYTKENKKRRDSLSKSCIIPETDEEYASSSSDIFQSPFVFNNISDNRNEFQISEKNAECLAHLISKSSIDQANMGIVNERNIYFAEENANESVSLIRNRSTESILALDYCSRESLISIADQCNLTDELSLASDCNSDNLIITQIDSISPIDNVIVCQRSIDNFQTDQIELISSDIYNDGNFEFQIDDSSMQMNNVIIENPRNDSAYSTSNTDVINHEIVAKRISDIRNKCTSEPDIGYHFKSQSCKKKTIMRKDITDSPSIIRETKTTKRQSSFSLLKEYESRHSRNSLKKGKINMGRTISTNWLNFTLESLNVDHVIVESLKVILSVLCDERTASDYITRRCWKDTLEEEAVNAALNVSDILIMEKKPNICAKEITTAIIDSLHEIITCVQLNQTSIWIYRVQIILELCNSLSICVEIIDHLIEKLKSFQSALINVIELQENTHAMINQLHLLFYALNISIQKYRIIVSRNQESRFTKNTMPHVVDLWKRNHRIDDEFEYMNLNLNITEMLWLNALENFSAASIENYLQFAEKSLSLFQALSSQ